MKTLIVWLLIKSGAGEWVRKALAAADVAENQSAVCQNEILKRIKAIEADVRSIKMMEASRRKQSGERLAEHIG